MYKVDYYTFPSGKSPVGEFILACQKQLRSKIERQTDSLEEFGLTITNPYLRKITGTPLWESRILGKDNTRIICTALVAKRVVILTSLRRRAKELRQKKFKFPLEDTKT